MKRIICMLLAQAMALSLCACGAKSGEVSESVEEPVDKTIELTAENIEEYLAFDFDYSDVERKTQIGVSFGFTDITFKTYPVRSGSFSDVQITLKVPLTNGWGVSSSDEAYIEESHKTLTCEFRLPANGEYEETHDLIAALNFRDPDTQNIGYTVKSASGTFTPAD